MGTVYRPLNNGSGCGGVMRAHPVGIAFQNAELAFIRGVSCAVATHGGREGHLPAGALAQIVSTILRGECFEEAVYIARISLEAQAGSQNTLTAIRVAMEEPVSHPTMSIESKVGHTATPKGGGWLGHDDLAIRDRSEMSA